jgi:hypothetical protein
MNHCIRCVIVALCYLSVPLSFWAADEKAPQSQWLVGASDLTESKPATVWLAVQPMASAKSVTVIVGTPHDTTISVSQAGNATCSTMPNQRISCVAPATDPLLLEYSVTALRSGTMRIVALVEYMSNDGKKFGYAAVSDRMVVRGVLEFGPTAVGIIGAVFGLIAGVLTQWFVSWRQGKQDDRKRLQDEQLAARKVQQDVERELLTGLSAELTKNHDMLTDYIEHGGAPPTLSVKSYNVLSKAAAAFLDTGSRSPYFKKLDPLYASIHGYNSEVAKGAKAEVIHAAAVALLAALVNLSDEVS